MRPTPEPRATFLVELYQSRQSQASLEHEAKRARKASEQLRAEGKPVWHVRVMFVPEDETCFHVFKARRRQHVAEACRRAGIAGERIVRALGPEAYSTNKEEPE